MGAFHEGHLSLMRRARAECGVVVVSLFVNPAQFAEGEDLGAYPRNRRQDAALAGEVGVDLMFAPAFEEIYPVGFATTVEVGGLTETLCGAPERRGSGHFRGVTTVVTKLLNICQPDVAYFGQKDFQQALAAKQLVRDLDIRVKVEVCPIVREADGLALSSRNAYLSDRNRNDALALKRALDAAELAINRGVRHAEYVEVVSATNLSPLDEIAGHEVLIAVAAGVGPARLIDNTIVRVETQESARPLKAERVPG